MPRTPRSTLFPYTTLFRSGSDSLRRAPICAAAVDIAIEAGLIENATAAEAELAATAAKYATSGLQAMATTARDRKSTRLNSSHSQISYAVFCLKKKTKETLPVIRYRTRDLTRLLPRTARPMRRMEKLTCRSDDMIILRG